MIDYIALKAKGRVPTVEEANDPNWVGFTDMYSGGSQKLKPFDSIYVQLPPVVAPGVAFEYLFDRNPDWVTCECCGDDFSYYNDRRTLFQSTGMHRNCDYVDGKYLEQGKPLPGRRQIFPVQDTPLGKIFRIESAPSESREPFMALDAYIHRPDVLLVFADEFPPYGNVRGASIGNPNCVAKVTIKEPVMNDKLKLQKGTLKCLLETINGLEGLEHSALAKSVRDVLYCFKNEISTEYQTNNELKVFDDVFDAAGWDDQGFRWTTEFRGETEDIFIVVFKDHTKRTWSL